MGLGEVYLGYAKRGIMILIVGYGTGFTASFFLGVWAYMFTGPYWAWVVYDTYKLAKKQQTQPSLPAKTSFPLVVTSIGGIGLFLFITLMLIPLLQAKVELQDYEAFNERFRGYSSSKTININFTSTEDANIEANSDIAVLNNCCHLANLHT